MELLAKSITIFFGLYLIFLFIMVLFKKEKAINFFSSFASSAKTHYIEQTLRMLAGIGVFFYSEKMIYPIIFKYFSYLLICVSVLLFLTPWKLHNKYGEWAIPLTIKYIFVYALFAFILGTFIVFCSVKPLFNDCA